MLKTMSVSLCESDQMRRRLTKLEVLPKRSRVGSDLDAIYLATGLPPLTTPDQLPKSERQMLNERGPEQFVAGLYQSSNKDPKTERLVGPPFGAARPAFFLTGMNVY